MTLPLRLISTDFDGTLHADTEDPPVPIDLQNLIAELQQGGVRWVINTGRDLSSLMEGIARARLQVQPDFVVVVEREIFIHQNAQYLPSADWNEACSVAHRELFARVLPDVPQLVQWIGERFRAGIYEDTYSPFCMIAGSNADADVIQAHVEDYCRTIPGLTFVRNDVYGRLSHEEFNKGTALQEIARQLGVAPGEVFAAGDHLNDIPMLSGKFAGCLAAPDNAIPLIKELVRNQGGYVSHQPWGHGVARALEHFLGRGKPG